MRVEVKTFSIHAGIVGESIDNTWTTTETNNNNRFF